MTQDIGVQWEGPGDADSHELTGRYVARKTGTYSVSVTYNGSHVQGSPWPLLVLPDAGRAARSTLAGLPSAFDAGKPVTVKLLAKDGFGNPTGGGDAVTIVADSAVEGEVSSVCLGCACPPRLSNVLPTCCSAEHASCAV